MIVNLVGHSGSGKSTVASLLEQDGHYIIPSYTTRKRRYQDEPGHTFISDYVGDSNYQSLILGESNVKVLTDDIHTQVPGKAIAVAEIHGEVYFATDKQFKDGINIYIVDDEGARQVHENVKDRKVITIFIQVDEDVRWERLGARFERKYSLNKWVDMQDEYEQQVTNRINDDRKLRNCVKCNYVVNGNMEIDEVYTTIKNILEVEYV